MLKINKIPIVLLTRFSVRNKKFMDLTGIDSESIRNQWLKHRIQLFKYITLSSIKSQIRRPDRWVLLLSKGDEMIIKECMGILDDWIIDLYISENESCGKITDEYIENYLGKGKQVIISRIDNDDALVPEYFELIHSVALENISENNFVIIPEKGCRWDGKSIQYMNYPNNPFVSMCSNDWFIERNNPLKINHYDLLKKKNFIADERKKASWMQILHGINAINKFKECYGDLENIEPQNIFSEFNIMPQSIEAIFSAKNTLAHLLRGNNINSAKPNT